MPPLTVDDVVRRCLMFVSTLKKLHDRQLCIGGADYFLITYTGDSIGFGSSTSRCFNSDFIIRYSGLFESAL